MRVVHTQGCGLDVQQTSVVACALLTEPDGTVQRETRPWPCGTMTTDLLALNDWLNAQGVRPVARESEGERGRARESTGVYWRPVYHLLEDDHEIILVNAQQVNVQPI